MKDRYLSGERSASLNTANLKLMQNMVMERAWGNPLGAFALITIRACERVEYHALNVYKTFVSLVERFEGEGLEPGHSVMTNEDRSKFEIEAFLAASKTLLDIHLDKKDALLKRHLGDAGSLYDHFAKVFDCFSYLFADGSVVNTIRNSSTHTKKQLSDYGFSARLESGSQGLHVVLPNLYSIDGDENLDLAEMFCQVSHVMTYFISELVQALAILVNVIKVPDHTLHSHYDSANWRVLVSYGPAGFTEKSLLLNELPNRGQLVEQSAG